MKISEIMEGKVPGSVRVTNTDGPHYFRPFFIDENDRWSGTNEKGFTASCNRYDENWRLYREPKKKVVRWLWCRSTGEVHLHMLTEEEAKSMKAGVLTHKLEWSKTEMDE